MVILRKEVRAILNEAFSEFQIQINSSIDLISLQNESDILHLNILVID